MLGLSTSAHRPSEFTVTDVGYEFRWRGVPHDDNLEVKGIFNIVEMVDGEFIEKHIRTTPGYIIVERAACNVQPGRQITFEDHLRRNICSAFICVNKPFSNAGFYKVTIVIKGKTRSYQDSVLFKIVKERGYGRAP